MDDRTSVKTIAELKALDDNIIPPGLIVFCEEDGVSYRRTLMVPDGTGNDFNLLWLPLGSGGKIEQEIKANVTAGAITEDAVIPVNTTVTTFVSMLLFDDRDPQFDCEFNVPAQNDITSNTNITNPVLNLSLNDLGGVTNFKKITYMNMAGQVIKEQNAEGGQFNADALVYQSTVTIPPSELGYNFSVKVDYDLTRTMDTSVTQNFRINFFWPIFRGIAENKPANEDDVKLLNKFVYNPEGFTYFKDAITCTNHYDVIAIPEVMGSIVRILDQNGFDITETYESSTVAISAPLANVTKNYTVYCSKEKQVLTNYSKKFYTVDPMDE
jgi:hypothetical protein